MWLQYGAKQRGDPAARGPASNCLRPSHSALSARCACARHTGGLSSQRKGIIPAVRAASAFPCDEPLSVSGRRAISGRRSPSRLHSRISHPACPALAAAPFAGRAVARQARHGPRLLIRFFGPAHGVHVPSCTQPELRPPVVCDTYPYTFFPPAKPAWNVIARFNV